jgi:hypothetical protein
MPRRYRRHNYPPDEELAALNKKVGMTKAADMLGIGRSTYHGHCQRNGIPTSRAMEPGVIPAEIPLDPNAEVSEVEMLRQRVQELESVARRDRKQNVYDERVVAAVEANLARAETKYQPSEIQHKDKRTEHEFVLLLSDLHAGETVSFEETGGINSYDWSIMLDRMDHLRTAIASYQDNRPYPVNKLRIFALGDQLSGNIHAELEATNEIPLAEATVQLGADLAEWVESMTEIFPTVTFDGVVGNHPRAHKKPWAKQGFDNADWTAYKIAETALRRNDNIQFDIPKSSQHRVTVADNWNCLLFHGDGIRSTMPGVPWGGVSRRVNALSAQYQSAGQPIDCYFLGHFHTANWVQTNAGWIGMNGSIKGPDEYSMKQFGGGSSPQQMLLTFHPQRGPTDCSVINL